MKSMLAGEPESVHGKHFLMGWEFFGKHGVRVGDWKLIRMPEPYGNNEWLLYNLRLDPAERHDVSKDEPEQLKTMLAYWTEYSEQANIILPSSTPMTY